MIDTILKLRFHVGLLFGLLMYSQLQFLDYKTALVISLCYMSLIIGIYLLNKITDKKEDAASGKGDEIHNEEDIAKYSCVLLFLVPLIFIGKDKGLVLMYVLVAAIGLWYSLRVPYIEKRLKELFIIKNVSAALMWAVPLGFLPGIVNGTVEKYHTMTFLLVFFIALAMEIFWDIKDIEGDKKAKIKTLPNHAGMTTAKAAIVVLLVFALALLAVYSFNLYSFIAICSLMMFALFAKQQRSIMYFHAVILIWVCVVVAALFL